MLTIGTIYRTPKDQQKDKAEIDGLPNFFYETNTPNVGFAFQKGIHNVGEVITLNGEKRIPLIIISSTPRKAGSEDTPWRDRYDPGHGYVKYYGDNKYVGKRPEETGGNKLLLEQFKYYNSENIEERQKNAVPVIFLERCAYDGRAKGNAIFQGFGVLESYEYVTQYNSNNSKLEYFANYLFHFCIFSLSEDNEQFDWRWIIDRCDPTKEVKNTLTYAPKSWKKWIAKGHNILHLLRRSVSGIGLVKIEEQKPKNSSLKILNRIYKYYGGIEDNSRKHDFEYLAMEVTIKTIQESGARCIPGWITKASGDGGVDFVLRIDIGQGDLATVKIIVLGQAKCTDPSKTISGKDIARTVARMKRGWIGAFVTTSYFSEPLQQEVKEDAYPLMLINGAKVARIVEQELFENNLSLEELEDYLKSLKSKYRQAIRIPEDVLDI